RREEFDLIIFLDQGALGYWCFRARRQGVMFQSTPLILLVAHPSEIAWHDGLVPIDQPNLLLSLEMERYSLAQADTVLVTTSELVDYVSEWGRGQSPTVLRPAVPNSVIAAIEDGEAAVPDRAAPRRTSALALLGVADESSGVRAVSTLLPQLPITDEAIAVGLVAIGRTGRLASHEDGFLLLSAALEEWWGSLIFR